MAVIPMWFAQILKQLRTMQSFMGKWDFTWFKFNLNFNFKFILDGYTLLQQPPSYVVQQFKYFIIKLVQWEWINISSSTVFT